MITENNDHVYKIIIHGKEYEVFFAKDGYIEFYEDKDPGKTGFIFKNIKDLSVFINDLSDVIEMERNYIQ